MGFSLSLSWTAIGVLAFGGLIYKLSRRPLVLNCSTEFHAANHGGTRSMKGVTLIVLHTTEGSAPHWTAGGSAGRQPSAKGVAEYFTSPASGGSAHYVVDDGSCYETLPDNVVPYGAPGANTIGLHVEMCGYAINPVTYKMGWTRDQWLAHDDTLRRAAAIAMGWSHDYGIPLRFLDAAALKRGERAGVTTHWEITKGLNGGSGHVDPGPAFPLDVFARYAGMSLG